MGACFSVINIDSRNEKRMYGSSEVNSFILNYSLLFLSEISPVSVSAVDARLAELQHYMQRETDVLVLAKDVVKQLEGISSLDQKALTEVGFNPLILFLRVLGWIQAGV